MTSTPAHPPGHHDLQTSDQTKGEQHMVSIRTAVEEAVGPDDIARASSPDTQMLLALAATGKHVYGGTVPPAVVARRRATGKRAKAARRVARGNR